jgi:hypothetical protein
VESSGDIRVENLRKLGIAKGICIFGGAENSACIMNGKRKRTPTAALGYVFVSWFPT